MIKQSTQIEVKVKEFQSGHFVKTDSFKGNPEQVVDIILKKYVGRNGYERLGSLIYGELKND